MSWPTTPLTPQSLSAAKERAYRAAISDSSIQSTITHAGYVKRKVRTAGQSTGTQFFIVAIPFDEQNPKGPKVILTDDAYKTPEENKAQAKERKAPAKKVAKKAAKKAAKKS